MTFDQLSQNFSLVKPIISYELFTIGSKPITLVSILIFFGILLTAWILSGYFRRLYSSRFSDRFDTGTQHTLKRLIHYSTLVIGFVVAIDFIGVDLTSLAVVASFLSVGIGFGMRNIASNFISPKLSDSG